MKNIFRFFLLCFCSPLFSSHPSLYRPYQRDVIILIDWDSELESLSYVFDASKANLGKGLGSAGVHLASALYNESVPIIVSSPIWRSILERAQLITDSAALSSAAYVSKYANIYKENPGFQNTLLTDTNFLAKLYKFCKRALETYDQVNAAIATEAINTKNMSLLAYRIDNRYNDATLDGFLKSPGDFKLWQGVNELLGCYLIAQKLKNEGDKWIFRKPDECMYLIIPKSYLNGVKAKTNEFIQKELNLNISLEGLLNNSIKDLKTDRFLTVDEMVLGIKFENWPALKNPFAIPTATCQEKVNSEMSDRFIKNQKYMYGGLLPQIIINSQDYNTCTQEQFLNRNDPAWIPHFITWNIYSFGHGSPPLHEAADVDINYYIMGLRERAMNAFLHFLNSINTRFLFYTSCYAAGHRLRSMYLEYEQGRIAKKKFNYTIVVGAITQAATISPVYLFNMPPYALPLTNNLFEDSIDKTTLKLRPIFYTNFNAFFNDLHMLAHEFIDQKTGKMVIKPVSYKNILLHVTDFTSDFKTYANIPQIRFAGTGWFNVIDLPEQLIRLTKTFIKAQAAEINRGLKDKLEINNKSVVLIDAEKIWHTLPGYAHSEINFPVKINTKLPKFISMVDGNAWHKFDKIDASGFGLLKVLNSFWGLSIYGCTYHIKELKIANDLNAQQAALLGASKAKALTLKNVYIFSNAPIPRDYEIYKTAIDNVAKYFLEKHIGINSLFGLTSVLKNSGVNDVTAHNIVTSLLGSFQEGRIKKIQDISKIILQQSLHKMQGITFMYNNSLYSSNFSLLDNAQVNNANSLLSKGLLPNLHNIAGPLPSYEEIIALMFPSENLPIEPSYGEVAKLIMDKKKLGLLLEEYEKRKLQGSKILDMWKNTLNKQERTFVDLFETSLSAREIKSDLSSLLNQLEIELHVLKKAI